MKRETKLEIAVTVLTILLSTMIIWKFYEWMGWI